MTVPELFKFVAAPIVFVLGILIIIFREPWSAAARRARRAMGRSEGAVNSQTPRFYVVAGAFAILWGLLVFFVPFTAQR